MISLINGVSVKIKIIVQNIVAVFFANLLMGCASQLTSHGEAIAQEAGAGKTQIQRKRPQLPIRSKYFASQAHEYMYKAMVAEIARLRGNHALAAKYFFDLATLSRDPQLAERATQAAWYAQKYHLATKAARLWIDVAPNEPKAQQFLVNSLLRQKQPVAEVVTHLEAMFDNLKDEPQRREAMMEAMLERQKDRRALALMKQLVAKRPNDPVVLLTYARLLIKVNQLDQALEVLRTLLSDVPDHAEAVPLYAFLLDKQDKRALALQWMKQALDKYPDKHEWRLTYARMLADSEQFEESIKQFQQILSQFPQQGDILYALGVLSLQTKQVSAAKGYFLKLIENGERLDTAHYYLGQIAQEENDLDKARYWYSQIKEGANYLNVQARIALILIKQGQLDRAIEHLRAVQVSDRKDAISLMQLEAELLIEQKRYYQAMDAYNRAINLKPDSTDVLYMRALLHEEMGSMAPFEQDLQRLLALEPENINALNALGYSLANKTERYEEAYGFIKQALDLGPNNYYILDSMGWVLYKMGNCAEAIVYLRKALAKQNDPEIAAHLGEVLWVSRDQYAAKEVWENALKAFPEDEKLRDVVRGFSPSILGETGEGKSSVFTNRCSFEK
ncbi:MAG: hypothetical protein DRR19_12335 [Candidatus Parabeggiatoa sp. nov. 1]|nr:MAG: hypothetical protein DRR19_12335 [Gammaproteobacteria bacterium]